MLLPIYFLRVWKSLGCGTTSASDKWSIHSYCLSLVGHPGKFNGCRSNGCLPRDATQSVVLSSVRPVTLIDCYHTGGNSSKIIPRLDTPGCWLSGDLKSWIFSKGDTLNFGRTGGVSKKWISTYRGSITLKRGKIWPRLGPIGRYDTIRYDMKSLMWKSWVFSFN